uniref:Unconventional myosin-IXa n=1 Tax=Talaromyces marneffei PM1 TaxID=1077442 RepID=A0A093VRF2_TALMA
MDPNQQQQQQQPQQGNDQSEDYLDKGMPLPHFPLHSHSLDFIETKFGQGKIDPVKMRDTNEKITDGARGMFEKFTGKKVPEKFSN